MSLLIGELAFEGDAALTDEVKAAVLIGSLIAALLATVLLKLRVRKYQALVEVEERDEDMSGIPDVYEAEDPEHHRRLAEIYERKAAEHRRKAEQHRLKAEEAAQQADEAAHHAAGHGRRADDTGASRGDADGPA